MAHLTPVLAQQLQPAFDEQAPGPDMRVKGAMPKRRWHLFAWHLSKLNITKLMGIVTFHN